MNVVSQGIGLQTRINRNRNRRSQQPGNGMTLALQGAVKELVNWFSPHPARSRMNVF
jgi:hypothetical protein